MEKDRIAKILIRGTNWVGDAIMTTPAVAAVRRNFPRAHISILVVPWVADVFRCNPDVNEVILYRRNDVHRGLAGKWKLMQELKQRSFDLAILLQNAFEAALIALWSPDSPKGRIQHRRPGLAADSFREDAAGVQTHP